ncbi:MAG: prepilin peptidase, partial [Armatimonadetes bacterium]|nr:prepilin peptidase [Armatimonadota bacterium]
FLWLKGRCSDCKKPIPWRDFAMVLLTACTWVAIFHRYNGDNLVSWVNVVMLALFASVLIAAVFIDLDHFIVPETLNRVGVVIGLGRDLLVLGVAFLLVSIALPDFGGRWNPAQVWRETVAAHTYFGWLPRGFVGAALYAGVLWLVSFFGFLAYAREENESLFDTARRFFSRQEDELVTPNAGMAVLPATAPAAPEEEEDDSPPIRLRFSPGFIVLLSAGLLYYVVGAWSLLLVVITLFAFVALTRTPTESATDALRRFFRADDLPYEYDAPAQELSSPAPASAQKTAEAPLITGQNVGDVWNNAPVDTAPVVAPPGSDAPPSFAETQAEADQFAKEAETGAHGGMGLGDAKLAITIGAILGPGQAILSLLFAAFFGAATGLILKAVHGKNTMRLAVPFVPFMAAGAFVCLLFGEQIIKWYAQFYAPLPAVTAPENASGNTPRVRADGTVELPSDRNLPRR